MRVNVRAGETFIYRDRGPATYRLGSGPPWAANGGPATRELRALGTLAIDDLEPGHYWLDRLEEDGSETRLCLIGVSFLDAGESDLRRLSSGRREAQASASTILAGYTWIELALIVLALALLGLDWWVLGRRARARGRA